MAKLMLTVRLPLDYIRYVQMKVLLRALYDEAEDHPFDGHAQLTRELIAEAFPWILEGDE